MSHRSHYAAHFTAFIKADKQRIEDFTGCIPRLLTPFLGHQGEIRTSLEPKIWNCKPLESVGEDTNESIKRLVTFYSLSWH